MKPVLSTTVLGPGISIAVTRDITMIKRPATPNDDQASRLRDLVREIEPVATAPAPAPAPIAAPQPPADAPLSIPSRILTPGVGKRHARVITVASGKGGVGKTSLSVNLCIALQQLGCRTTLVDGDLSLGNVDVMCGVRANGHLGHVIDGERAIQEIIVEAPGGFRLVPGASGVARLAELNHAERNALVRSFDALDAGSDVIVLDCGAGIGPGVFTMIDVADLTLVVTTPEPTAITDAYALVKCAASRSRRGESSIGGRMALVVNQAADLDEANEVHQRISGVTGKFLDVHLPLAGWIRADRAMGEAVRSRRPLVLSKPLSPASRSITDLSASVCELLSLGAAAEEQRGGLGARVLRLFTGRNPDPRPLKKNAR